MVHRTGLDQDVRDVDRNVSMYRYDNDGTRTRQLGVSRGQSVITTLLTSTNLVLTVTTTTTIPDHHAARDSKPEER
jgi:hypothetical protein